MNNPKSFLGKSRQRIGYSVTEIADSLGVCERLIRDEIARGKLQTTRIGRRVIVTESQLNSYLESNVNRTFDPDLTARKIIQS